MNERTNERTNERANEWNEWINEWIEWQTRLFIQRNKSAKNVTAAKQIST